MGIDTSTARATRSHSRSCLREVQLGLRHILTAQSYKDQRIHRDCLQRHSASIFKLQMCSSQIASTGFPAYTEFMRCGRLGRPQCCASHFDEGGPLHALFFLASWHCWRHQEFFRHPGYVAPTRDEDGKNSVLSSEAVKEEVSHIKNFQELACYAGEPEVYFSNIHHGLADSISTGTCAHNSLPN